MPNIAVLGGTGFAGRNVCDVLAGLDAKVVPFSRATGCDLLDLSRACSKLAEFKPDYIVNCAAHVGSVKFVTDYAADVVDVNMRMILNVYQIARQLGDAVVVNPIANCAYPGIMDFYEERGFWDGPIHPSVLSYGSTRRMMWVLSKCYSDQYGVQSVNLFVPNMYGPYDSTDPNKAHALNALAMKFVRAVKDDLPEIEVWGTGKPVREWLFVHDFAALLRHIIAAGVRQQEPLNIGQNRGYSVLELVDALRRLTGYQGRIVHNTHYPDGAPQKIMDDRCFRQRFPDFRFTPLDDGLEATLAYYRTQL